MGLKHDNGGCIPADHPYYPPRPAHLRNARFQFVFFRADPEAVARLLPEPLAAAADGGCLAGGIAIPFSSHYGPFQEAFLMHRCLFREQGGYRRPLSPAPQLTEEQHR